MADKATGKERVEGRPPGIEPGASPPKPSPAAPAQKIYKSQAEKSKRKETPHSWFGDSPKKTPAAPAQKIYKRQPTPKTPSEIIKKNILTTLPPSQKNQLPKMTKIKIPTPSTKAEQLPPDILARIPPVVLRKTQAQVPSPMASQIWQGMTPWDEATEQASSAGVALMAAEILIPGVYVARHWDELSPGERALFIGLDVLSLIPVAGAALRGARLVGTAGKMARVSAATKSLGKEIAVTAVAPVNTIIHPISGVKQTGRSLRSLAENIANPRKLPEAVITTSHGTVRIKINKKTTAADAEAIRNTLMDLAAKGERPIVNVAGQSIELTQSPLMREAKKVGGGLVHSTPQGEYFTSGLKVAKNPSRTRLEQGLFLSNEPLPRFAQATAFGRTGEKSAFIIMGKESSKKAVQTGKIYTSKYGQVAELEKKFAVGTSVPKPNQRLYTRIGIDGKRVEIWLEKPLSNRQIFKLKAEGLLEQVKGVFREPIRIKGSGAIGTLTPKEVKQLASVLKMSKSSSSQAKQLIRAEKMSLGRLVPPRLSKVTGRIVSSSRVKADGKLRNAISQSRRKVLSPDRSKPLRRKPLPEVSRLGIRSQSRRPADAPAMRRATDVPPTRRTAAVLPTRRTAAVLPTRRTAARVKPLTLPKGSIAFAMGKRKSKGNQRVAQWYYIPPPYDIRKPIPITVPAGVKNSKGTSPYNTIQTIGKNLTVSVPKKIAFDLGITDGLILDGTNIYFKGKGLETDVGTRIESPTTGLAITQTQSQANTYGGGTIRTKTIAKRKRRRKTTRSFADLLTVGRIR